MADLIKKIKTNQGPLPIDYNALANLPSGGSATQPVYFANGIPVETACTLEKSVPANAVFTDTTELTSMTGVLPIEKGGTGATTVDDARSAIGAVNKAGDFMTGNLVITTDADPALGLMVPNDGNPEGNNAYSKIHKSTDDVNDYGLQLRDYARGGRNANTSSALVVCDAQTNLEEKLQFVVQENGVNTNYKLYGEHCEPVTQEVPTQSSFAFLTVSRFGQAKRLRIMNSNVVMTAGTAYEICTLSQKYRPSGMTYSSYVCINANSSGAKYGLIYIDAKTGLVRFTPYSNLSASDIIIIDVSYV